MIAALHAVIGLAQSGRARPWQISAALTAVRQAFPVDKVRVGRSTLGVSS
jgi:hypothetical protein